MQFSDSLGGGKAQLVRWTSQFDCGHPTEWWYCIKDCPFDIHSLKAKRRYEINKGKRNFEVKIIRPMDYLEDLFEVTFRSYAAYPSKYRPAISKEKFYKEAEGYDIFKVYGAFDMDNERLCGYSLIHQYDSFIRFNVQKVIPEYEKMGINAALVYQILCDFNEELSKGVYIVDGNRNIVHETHFQDYLEKYFCFRKAYCVLHIKYKPFFGAMVKCIYPFRSILRKCGNGKIFHYVNSLMNMEEIRKSFEN